MDNSRAKEALGILQEHVARLYEERAPPYKWCQLPEIPSKEEIMPKRDNDRRQAVEEWDDYQKDPVYDPDLPVNIIDRAWPSKMDYLGAHYQILREDAIAPLRRSVDYFRQHQQMGDNENTYVYNDVHVKGLNLGALGAAFRITFSTERCGKRIRWEQSKRLQQATMVALSPERDMFGSVCKTAIVAARPLSGLQQDPPEVDIFWGNTNELVIDPSEAYVMLEARVGYFEAYRHMLVALQKIPHERFELQNHLVELDDQIGAPDYLEADPIMNLSSLTGQKDDPDGIFDDESLNGVDVLTSFPHVRDSSMDSSQMAAFQRILTKKLAVVQGPPGTGKTFTSVAALRVLIQNAEVGGPPIVIAAQTNHALDQLLNHVLEFEPGIVRLGGRSSFENARIRSRTLYELRMMHGQEVPNGGQGLRVNRAILESKINAIKDTLSLLLSRELLTDELLREKTLINERQQQSLYETGWSTCAQQIPVENKTAIESWLTESQLTPVPCTPQVNFGFQMEDWDEDLDDELAEDPELEEKGHKDEDKNDLDAMLGEVVLFQRKITGVSSPGMESRKVSGLLRKHNNLYDIPVGMRGAVYRYWEKQLDKEVRDKMRRLLQEYAKCVRDTKITKFLCNIRLIKHLGVKVIGCTTTGLSKYRALLSALNPRTLLIEEAAETLEGMVIAGMFDSLEHLILVGDHKQLQARCSVPALEVEPYYLNTSMFERLINNGIPYTMLNEQRRMITDVRKLLCIEPEPFYRGLRDHPSVLDRRNNRPGVPGMGGKDVWFFHHNWPESRTPDFSMVNHDEAEMLTGFFNYLVLNGTEIGKITILSFYNGQKKRILQELKKHPNLGRGNKYNVHTVDSFQGEENDIILLSLVRSNIYLSVGFLESQNRLVVALSRARRGLYLFGNAITLIGAEGSRDGMMGLGRDPLWGPLTRHMKDNGQMNIDAGLPITCQQHEATEYIVSPDEWFTITAGCKRKCTALMACGHPCPLTCHPFDHSLVICQTPCEKTTLECGHACSTVCGKTCRCEKCNDVSKLVFITNPLIKDDEEAKYDKSIKQARANGDIVGLKNRDIRGPNSFNPNGIYRKPSYWEGKNLDSGGSTSASPDMWSPAQQNSREGNPRLGTTALVSPPSDPSGRNVGAMLGRTMCTSPRACHRKPGDQVGVNSLQVTSLDNSKVTSRGSAEKWKSWNAKEADREMFQQRLANDVAIPKLEKSKMVYNETFRPTGVKGGMRIKGGAVENIVGGAQNQPANKLVRPVVQQATLRPINNTAISATGIKPSKNEAVVGGAEKKPAHKPVRPVFAQATLRPINNIAAGATGTKLFKDENVVSFETAFGSMGLTRSLSDPFIGPSPFGDLIDLSMENLRTTANSGKVEAGETEDDDEEQLIQL